MSYYLKNSYCSPNPFVVVQPVLPSEAALQITVKEGVKNTQNTLSPEVFGPSFWFMFHTGSVHLPENLSPISAQRIKYFINGIPEMVPCVDCSEHSRAFIEANRNRIDTMTRGDEVFRFFVDFHNYVNKRLNKPLFTYDQAYKMYKSGVQVKTIKY